MLGSALIAVLSKESNIKLFGTFRTDNSFFSKYETVTFLKVNDLSHSDTLVKLIEQIKPNCIVNCAGPRFNDRKNEKKQISLYSLLTRRLDFLCNINNIRLIQISSDGVFSGAKGNYTELDFPDAEDSYGVAKILGEAVGPLSLTIRTSIIGPEIASRKALLSWFLSQEVECKCYTNYIFSGLPTVILAETLRDFVLFNKKLQGLYHIASDPISRYDLFRLVSLQYKKDIRLVPDSSIKLDRSLSGKRFQLATGFTAPTWAAMIEHMHREHVNEFEIS